VVGRAAEHAVGKIRDHAMAARAARELLARPRLQEIDRAALAALLEAHRFALGDLHVIDRRHGARRVPERRVRGDVGDALGADVDHPAVAQRL
jgi:hypothetical protein